MKPSNAQIDALERLVAKTLSNGTSCLQECDVRVDTTTCLYKLNAIEHVETKDDHYWRRRGSGRTTYHQKVNAHKTYVRVTPEGHRLLEQAHAATH